MRTILMAYRGSEQDKQVLRWLCRLAREKKSNLRLVYVLMVGFAHEVDDPNAPGAQEAERILLEAEQIADEEGVPIAADMVQARDVGIGLVREAEELEADLLVMTDHRHLLPLESPLGLGTVAYVLKHAPCPVWVVYEPLQA